MKNIVIVTVPETYSQEQKNEIRDDVKLSIETDGIVVIREGVQISCMPRE